MELKDHDRPGRKQPFGLRWYVPEERAGKIKYAARCKFYATAEDRAEGREQIEKTLSKTGTTALHANPARLRRWQAAEALLSGADPVDVAKFWIQHRGTKSTAAARWSDIEPDYIAANESTADPEHWRHVTKALARFSAMFGRRMVSTLEPAELGKWLAGFGWKPVTRKNVQSVLSAAFAWALEAGRIASNPWLQVKRPRISLPEPEVLTVEQTRQLFAANQDRPGLCARLALGLFAGLRASAVSRVEWADLDFEQKGILTGAAKTKKNRRQFLQGHPDNLWKWLERAKAEDFAKPPPAEAKAFAKWKAQTLRHWQHERLEALIRAGLAERDPNDREKLTRHPPKNWARHSFATYHVNAFRNPSLTALLVSHQGSPKILFNHYVGVSSEETGRAFFAIEPQETPKPNNAKK